MEMTPQEADAVEKRIAAVEARTGVEVVAAVVARSDDYPEIAWKAIALGVGVAAVAVVITDLARPDWVTAHTLWFSVLPLLAGGAVALVLALAVPEFPRLLLDRLRAAREVRQHAQAMSVERRLFGTRSRLGLLVLASVFERRVEVVADAGFDGRVDAAAWRGVVEAMETDLRAARPGAAFLRALDRLEALLVERGFGPRDGGGELSNRPVDDEALR